MLKLHFLDGNLQRARTGCISDNNALSTEQTDETYKLIDQY